MIGEMTTLAIVGDIFLQEALSDKPELDAVRNILQSADIAFGNLETPVSERGAPVEKWINMRMSPKLLDDVRSIGFDIVTIANNHLMDYGEDAFYDTLKFLSQYQIQAVGGGRNLDEAWQPNIMINGDQKIGFVAAASTLGPGMAADNNRPGVAPIHVSESYNIDFAASMEQPGSAPYVFTRAWAEDVERAVQAVQDATQQADFVVVALHWGVPPAWRSRFQDGLADYQIAVGHQLIEAGADVIVGHHPHSLQTVEMYLGKPIFYSLGNFIFHHNVNTIHKTIINRNAPYTLGVRYDPIWSESMIVVVNINENGSPSYKMQPVLLNEHGNPILLKGEEGEAVIKRLASMSPDANIEYHNQRGYLIA